MMKVIFGLGNPGVKYSKTKHNVGFMLIDRLAEQLNITVDKNEFEALTGTGFWNGEKIMLVKPQTFMNLSGKSVWQIIDYYADQIEDFIVVYDDMDLALGSLRFKQKGSAGGHNGVKSIIASLNSQEFDRLKIGIGQKKFDAVHHVLGEFSKEEMKIIEEGIDHGIAGLELWCKTDIKSVMNQYNNKNNQ